MPRTRWCLLFFCLLLLPATALATTCPPDTLQFVDNDGRLGNGGVIAATDAARDVFHQTTSSGTTATQWAWYDIPNGRIGAVAYTACWFMQWPGSANPRVVMTDRFTIVGPPSASPVPFEVVLAMDLKCTGARTYFCFSSPTMTCEVPSGCVTADMRDPDGGERAQFASCATYTGPRELALPLSRMPGQEFTLRTECSAEGTAVMDFFVNDDCYNRRAEVMGVLVFRGLPPGYQVVSCQGYAGTGVVPARRATWGSLKSLYR